MKRSRIQALFCLLAAFVWVQGYALAGEIPQGKEGAYREYILKRAETLQSLGVYGDWPVEEKAALDAYRERMGLTEEGAELHVLPGDGDISQEEALSLAQTAVVERLGAEKKQLERFQVQYEFLSGAEGSGQYRWRLLMQSTEYVEPYTAYWVELESPSGELVRCEESYSLLLPAEEGGFLPEEGDISPEEAEKIAREYGAEHFEGHHPIPDWVLSGYRAIARIYFDDELGRYYGVELNPFDNELFDYFGTYSVAVDPQTGIVWDGHQGNG